MDKLHYDEMVSNLTELEKNIDPEAFNIFLFGHCNATEELADLLLGKGLNICAILDNSELKHGLFYKGIPVVPPNVIASPDARDIRYDLNGYNSSKEMIVLIVTRFYEAMNAQLRELGFSGQVCKLVDYNTYAEYSLSEDTIRRKRQRIEYGRGIVEEIADQYPGCFRIMCPFGALGDIYFAMSYLPYFERKRGIDKCVICVVSNVCAKVVKLFGDYEVHVLKQTDMDAMIQAELFMRDKDCFIAHQDRPYVIQLHRALHEKCIPLDMIYRCGIYGLPVDCKPYEAVKWREYGRLSDIEKDNAVILSPYAKSVTALPDKLWTDIVDHYLGKGYQLFTNVSGDEQPLQGTQPISPDIAEMRSVVEKAGTFIGIRSGICDVIRAARCRKTALYPDYNYGDTRWKSIDMYSIEGFENIVAGDDFNWPGQSL